mmetsp:Transcript_24730/g.61392  ORF Transcript_24730/g.61392 Transcript_24730/m.61392 type:complete len:269 (-) Transcript_24730:95-901(-)
MDNNCISCGQWSPHWKITQDANRASQSVRDATLAGQGAAKVRRLDNPSSATPKPAAAPPKPAAARASGLPLARLVQPPMQSGAAPKKADRGGGAAGSGAGWAPDLHRGSPTEPVPSNRIDMRRLDDEQEAAWEVTLPNPECCSYCQGREDFVLRDCVVAECSYVTHHVCSNMAVTAPSNDLTWCLPCAARAGHLVPRCACQSLLSLSGVALLIRSVWGASTCCQAFCRSAWARRCATSRFLMPPGLAFNAPPGWQVDSAAGSRRPAAD